MRHLKYKKRFQNTTASVFECVEKKIVHINGYHHFDWCSLQIVSAFLIHPFDLKYLLIINYNLRNKQTVNFH